MAMAMCTEEWPTRVPHLASLALRATIRHLRRQVRGLGGWGTPPPHAAAMMEALAWVPPVCRAALLHGLAPTLEAAAQRCDSEAMLDLLDDMALALLSPAATSLHMDRYRFPSRRSERYLTALSSARGLSVLESRGPAEWKGEPRPLSTLATALTNMARLRRLQLRHLHLHPDEMVSFLRGVARDCPLLAELDLKHGAVTDECVLPLLDMARLTHLNLSMTPLTIQAMEVLLKGPATLRRLEVIVYDTDDRNNADADDDTNDANDLYDLYNVPSGRNDDHLLQFLLPDRPRQLIDLQASVIFKLWQQQGPSAPPLPLPRTTYTLAPGAGAPLVGVVCRACPLLQRVTVWQCAASALKPLLLELGELRHLRAINLCGLEWWLVTADVAINDEPMPLSRQVVEITLTESSYVDGAHLGALGICFPQVTHLRVKTGKKAATDGRGTYPWDGGRVFSDLLYLEYEGDLFIGSFGRWQRQQGLHSQLDVLLGWCEGLRSLTLYTTTTEEATLVYALRNNRLRHLEELRIGLIGHRGGDLTSGVIRAILKDTADLRVLGRVDWWRGVTRAERRSLLVDLRRRFRRLEVFGKEEEEEEEEEGRPDVEEDPEPLRSLDPDDW